MRSVFDPSLNEYDEFGNDDLPTELMIPIVLASRPVVDLAPAAVQPVQPEIPVSPLQSRRSSVPVLVGLAFVMLQAVLLARVVLMLFGADSTNAWIGWLFLLSSAFAFPFKLLLDVLPLPSQIGPDIVSYVSPLMALLVYGVLSRVLVRFLKAYLNSR